MLPTATPLRIALLGFCLVGCVAARLPGADAGILVRSGQKIGFMGDSITAQGNAPDGYIGLVIFGLQVEGVTAIPLPAGVPGHTSGNMRSRVDPQILSQGANWMTLSCGVNDVHMQAKGGGVDLKGFIRNVTAMVEAAEAKQVQVMLLTPTPIGEDLDNDTNHQLAPYVAFMRSYAAERHLALADVNAAFTAYLRAPPTPAESKGQPGKRLLADGLHPNKTGQALMARTVLAAFGVPAADLPKIEAAQMANPLGMQIRVSGREAVLISPSQYDALVKLANGRTGGVAKSLGDLWTQALTGMGAGPVPTAEQQAELQVKFHALVDAYIAAGGKP